MSDADGADELSDAELQFMQSEGPMLPVKSFELTESTHRVPGMAADEVHAVKLEQEPAPGCC